MPCGPIYSIDQMFDDPQVKHLGIAQHVPNERSRHIRLVGQPVTLSRTPSSMAARPPEFGEQTEEVLAEFGFGKDEIVAQKLSQGGVTQRAPRLTAVSRPIFAAESLPWDSFRFARTPARSSPFSAMNSIPAFSSAVLIFVSVSSLIFNSPSRALYALNGLQ